MLQALKWCSILLMVLSSVNLSVSLVMVAAVVFCALNLPPH